MNRPSEQTMNLQQLKRISLSLGIGLLALSVVLGIAALTGVIDLPQNLIAGESTVHSIARVAIVGCLLSALGTMD